MSGRGYDRAPCVFDEVANFFNNELSTLRSRNVGVLRKAMFMNFI